MMNLRATLRIAIIYCAAVVPGQGWAQDPWQKVQVIGTVVPALGDESMIEVTTQDGKTTGCSTYKPPSGVLCEADVPRGASSGTIQIRVRGYKKYQLTVPSLKFDKDVSRVPVGSIRLTPSEMPQVKRIVESRGADGSRRFELTLNNTLSRDILIKQVQINAARPGDGSACCCPPTAVFKIDQNLLVSAGGQSKLSTKGAYVETVRGSDYTVQTRGEISNFLCDNSLNLSISMPASFLVPKSSHSAVQFVLPAQFSVQGSEYCCTSPRFIPKERPTVAGQNQVSKFTHFEFALTPDDDQELDIKAEHPKGKSR